jgi:hypothetical protein
MRRAQCACGDLKAEAKPDPQFVVACHCEHCQRRTGAPFGVSAYYGKIDVVLSGESVVYERISDAGRWVKYHFCPSCGTTLYWFLELSADMIGIAAGCFADPDFPPPQLTVYMKGKHSWVEMPRDLPIFEASAV